MMPRSSVLIIRASLIALIAGAIPGLLHAAAIAVPANVHADVMLLGFMIPFAFGTASWILPKKGGVRPVTLPACIYYAGLLLLVASYVAPVAPLEAAGRGFIAAGSILFVGALAPRVRHIAVVRRNQQTTTLEGR